MKHLGNLIPKFGVSYCLLRARVLTFYFCNHPLISPTNSQELPMHQLVFSYLAMHGLQGEQKERNHLEILVLSHISDPSSTTVTGQPLHILLPHNTVYFGSNSLRMAKGHQQRDGVRSRSTFAYGLPCHRAVIPCHTKRRPTRSPHIASSTRWLPTGEITVGSIYDIILDNLPVQPSKITSILLKPQYF